MTHLPDQIPTTRRQFLGLSATLGAAAVSSLSLRESQASLHFPARAKRVVFLFQSGAPSQIDLLDPKPQLRRVQGQDLPDSIRKGQRLTGMTATQERFPVASSKFKLPPRGESGVEISELTPHIGKIADDLCVIRSMHTEAINHDPAITFFQTGAQLAGRPSIGAWLAYGLGTLNDDLPTFVAMVSGSGGQPLYDRLWGSGFLESRYQGTKFQSQGDPVPYLSSPAGLNRASREQMIHDINALNQIQVQQRGDPETIARMTQYQLAFRMQTSVPSLVDISEEPE